MSRSSIGWGGRSALFTNSQTHGGFDGLSMADAGAGAYAFAQAEETPKTTWLIAGQTAQSAATLAADWDALRGHRACAASSPRRLRRRRRGNWRTTGRPCRFRPPIWSSPRACCRIPPACRAWRPACGGLSDGVWWLPSYRAGELFEPGDAFSLGPLLRGYKLTDPDGGCRASWSGRRTAR